MFFRKHVRVFEHSFPVYLGHYIQSIATHAINDPYP